MMKKLLLLSIVILSALSTYSQCADEGNIYTFSYGGKTYEIVKETKNWDDAAACAVERGGYLVEINDLAEQNAVYDAILNGAGVSTTYTSISNGGGIAYVWIGATDSNNEGTWAWDGDNDVGGDTFWTGEGSNGAGGGSAEGGAYINWGGTSGGTPNEPDDYGSGQDHGAIGLAGWPSGTTMLGAPGEWNDIIGTSLLYFVIEIDEASSINNNTQFNEIKIYPNPTSGEFFIEGNAQKIEIYNSIGQLVQTIELKQNLTKLNCIQTPGLYFIKSYTNLSVVTKRIIVE